MKVIVKSFGTCSVLSVFPWLWPQWYKRLRINKQNSALLNAIDWWNYPSIITRVRYIFQLCSINVQINIGRNVWEIELALGYFWCRGQISFTHLYKNWMRKVNLAAHCDNLIEPLRASALLHLLRTFWTVMFLILDALVDLWWWFMSMTHVIVFSIL